MGDSGAVPFTKTEGVRIASCAWAAEEGVEVGGFGGTAVVGLVCLLNSCLSLWTNGEVVIRGIYGQDLAGIGGYKVPLYALARGIR